MGEEKPLTKILKELEEEDPYTYKYLGGDFLPFERENEKSRGEK